MDDALFILKVSQRKATASNSHLKTLFMGCGQKLRHTNEYLFPEHPLVLLSKQPLGTTTAGEKPAIPGYFSNVQTSSGSVAFAKKYGHTRKLVYDRRV
ncbi:MAG: hypothetical protein M1472_00240 [Planctomycetes bacterium]|jgi:hypothetical protein|nr:hypothetical protein [Planctomycetota bacterium]MDA8378981.1 hypothetical protein [Planctomycetia bacterium]